MSATKDAVRPMINHLEARRSLIREEAYVLCSAAGDRKINEEIDTPNGVVPMYLPEVLFSDT